MQVSLERQEKCIALLDIELDADEVSKAIDGAYRTLVRKVNVPGFRRGKAPRAVFERHVGKERLLSDALDELLGDGYRRAVKETDIEPIAPPELDVVSFGEAEPLKFKAKVTVRPEVKLGDYLQARSGIELEPASLPDGEVDRNIDSVRNRMAKLVPAAEQVAAPSRFVVIDSQVSVPGREQPMDKVEGQVIELGSEDVFPEVSAALEGAAPGEVRQAQITVADDHPDPELQGKVLTVTMDVKEVKEVELPEVNDEFARQVAGVDTVQELRNIVENRLLRLAEAEARGKYERAVIDKVVDEAEVEVPELLIDRYLGAMLESFNQDLAQRGFTLDTYLEASGQTEDEFMAERRNRAERMAKVDLVLNEVAKVEKVSVSPADVGFKLQEYSKRYGKPVAELRAEIETPDRLDDIVDTITRTKTVALLAEGSADAWRAPVPPAAMPDVEGEGPSDEAEGEMEEADG